MGSKAKIAVLNVGETIDFVFGQSPDKRKIHIIHEPEKDDPSHSGIFNLLFDDILIAELIAKVIKATYPAKELKG